MGVLDSTLTRNARDGGEHAAAGPPSRLLVVFEPGRSGRAALGEAAELADAGSELSVITLAPEAKPLRYCRAGEVGPYNRAVREEAVSELRDARDILGHAGERATFTVLSGCPEPPLAAWVSEHEFELVLIPARRLSPGGSHLARMLRRATAAEIRVVR
jgi:hypothetical protein